MTHAEQTKGWTSASNAEADSLCPGRHLAQKGLPESESEDATRGNRVHDSLAEWHKTGITALTSVEDVDLFESCRDIGKKVVLQFFGEEVEALRVEERFWMRCLDINGAQIGNGFEHSGKPDVVFRKGGRALILDYKTGSGDVAESPSNMQLRDLAVLVSRNLMVDEIGVAIVQPLATHSPSICLYGADELTLAEADMFTRVRASNQVDALRVGGEKQCKYCRAKLSCVEYQKFAGGMLPATQSLLDVPVSAWSPEQCAEYLSKKSVAQKWLDECDDAVKARMIGGQIIPGYKLKDGAKKETITEPEMVFQRFIALGGNAAQYMAAVSVTKGKLKDAVASVTQSKGKILDGHIAALIDGCTETKQNAPSIVKE